jgi:N-hydroxyarylamine O-acetyltransferase
VPNQLNIGAYLQRLNYTDSVDVNLQTLRSLQVAHLLSVPFENLDVALGQPIYLDDRSLFNKIVKQRRGGFCYELNSLFSKLLQELGFDVTLLSARFIRADGSVAPEFDHLVLLVQLEEPWLVDVGFGDSFRKPLPLQPAMDVEKGDYRLICNDDRDWTLQRREDETTWQDKYRFTLQPRQLADFTEMCHYHQTSPETLFTQKRLCTIATPEGRITLIDMQLTITQGSQRNEQLLSSQSDYTTVLHKYFGIDLGG